MTIYLPRRLDIRIKQGLEIAKKLEEEAYLRYCKYLEEGRKDDELLEIMRTRAERLKSSEKQLSPATLFGTELIIPLFGYVNNYDTVILKWSPIVVAVPTCNQITIPPENNELVSIFEKPIACLHTHPGCFRESIKQYIRDIPPEILQTHPIDDIRGCIETVYCFSAGDLHNYIYQRNRGRSKGWVEVLYCEPERKYVAINLKMEMIKVEFYGEKMKVDVFDLQGKPIEKIDLPEVFKEMV